MEGCTANTACSYNFFMHAEKIINHLEQVFYSRGFSVDRLSVNAECPFYVQRNSSFTELESLPDDHANDFICLRSCMMFMMNIEFLHSTKSENRNVRDEALR